MTAKPFNIAIAGLGTVGCGVVDLIARRADALAAQAGRAIQITAINARDKNKQRPVDVSAYRWIDDTQVLATLDDVDCVVELMGGEGGAALSLTQTALSRGIPVVTANKAMLAHHGAALAKLAEDNKAGLGYEAAVAGGIPVIRAVRSGLLCNEIVAVQGILNGTCNYILTQMRETGRDFGDVLAEAQEKGYAEADPTFDVDGIDAAHKLSLLSALCFGAAPDFASLSVTGIRAITARDIGAAEELGYRIKLIGSARMNGQGAWSRSVEPVLLPHGSPLAGVEDVFNAVQVEGGDVGRVFLQGRGAGAGPTASAVVSDIIDMARGERRPLFGVPAGGLKRFANIDAQDTVCAYYVRTDAQALEAQGIAAAQAAKGGVITTPVSRAKLDQALAAIGGGFAIRVEGE